MSASIARTRAGRALRGLKTVLDVDGLRLVHREATRALRSMEDGLFDAVVTDPPYDLTAASRGGSQRENDPSKPYGRHALQSKPSAGFMGKKWDGTGIAFRPAFWREVLRVCKPGAFLLSFGGTRTYHRMVCAMEDAGWEIRDSIHWIYGTGFPKSMNLEDEHEGKGTALKPVHEPIVVARKPVVGSVEKNVRKFGTGAMNLDACRVDGKPRTTHSDGNRTGNSGPDAIFPMPNVETSEPDGRWPPNVVLTHSISCRHVGQTSVRTGTAYEPTHDRSADRVAGAPDKMLGRTVGYAGEDGVEVVDAYECAPDCPIAELDRQSGHLHGPGEKKSAWRRPTIGYGGTKVETEVAAPYEPGGGGASRFFPTFEWSETDDLAPFYYVAKAGKAERNEGLRGIRNSHSTVKPITLMRWLVRLVTPPGGLVLDPFVGSGTTILAARAEDRRCLGIEEDDEYVEIVRARVAHATKQPSLFDVGAVGGSVDRRPQPQRSRPRPTQAPLFDQEVVK